MKRLLVVSLFFLASTISYAQHHATAPAGTGAVALVPGLGVHHHPTSTANAEAQAFFDQGLILVYAFNHEEAVRSSVRNSSALGRTPTRNSKSKNSEKQ
jgi:hypothetical protein